MDIQKRQALQQFAAKLDRGAGAGAQISDVVVDEAAATVGISKAEAREALLDLVTQLPPKSDVPVQDAGQKAAFAHPVMTRLQKKGMQMASTFRRFVGPHTVSREKAPPAYPKRQFIPDDKVAWDTPMQGYKPEAFTAPVVFKHDRTKFPPGDRDGWADPPDTTKDQIAARKTYENNGTIRFDDEGNPLNPMGRTGVAGRGELGKFGPNQAADPILIRRNPETGEPEMLAIERKNPPGSWAIPGGMVDDGEDPITAAARELFEEASVPLDLSDAQIVYQGYVDDPRNTDNSWMETTAAVKLIDDETAKSLKPKAGDDAKKVRWMPLTDANLSTLYASHGAMVRDGMKALGL